MPTQDDAHFRLRVPARLKSRVEAEAKHHSRSINAEIIARLEEYDDRLNDIRWLKTEMLRLRDERDFAESSLRKGAQMKLDDALALALPRGLLRRIRIAADENGRTPLEEILQTLDRSYPAPPPMSLDWFNEEWIARILAAPPNERAELVVAANMVLEEHGGVYEVWLQKSEGGQMTDSVVLGRKFISDGAGN